jgi:hypothetical protein
MCIRVAFSADLSHVACAGKSSRMIAMRASLTYEAPCPSAPAMAEGCVALPVGGL